jgi:hypothetical protein
VPQEVDDRREGGLGGRAADDQADVPTLQATFVLVSRARTGTAP